jgi:hypothetical protein
MQRVDPLRFAEPQKPDVEDPRAKQLLRRLATWEECDHATLSLGDERCVLHHTRDTGTNTEKANQEFFDRVRRIAGVAEVETRGGEALSERSFIVYLERRDIEVEYSVYELKGQMLDRYPGARLDVLVLQQNPLVESRSDVRSLVERL